MKRDQIKVTTPEHSVIYAIGSSALTNEAIWGDINDYQNRNFRPGYVLNVNSAGPLVLGAAHHPDSKAATSSKQAIVLEATGYTYADYQARQAVLEKYSHWAELNQRDEFEAEMAELAVVPRGWRVERMQATYVRMLWAEYAAGLQQRADFRAFQKAEKEAETKDKRARHAKIIDAIRKKATIPHATMERLIQSGRWERYDTLELPLEVFEELLGITP
jgi:hypothetical protein